MKRKTTRNRATAKKTSKNKTAKRTSRKRVTSTRKKKVITDRKDAILTKPKTVFDDTAAKMKTLLPGEPETADREPDQRDRELK